MSRFCRTVPSRSMHARLESTRRCTRCCPSSTSIMCIRMPSFACCVVHGESAAGTVERWVGWLLAKPGFDLGVRCATMSRNVRVARS